MGFYGDETVGLIGGVVETLGPHPALVRKLKPGIEEYELRGSPASTL